MKRRERRKLEREKRKLRNQVWRRKQRFFLIVAIVVLILGGLGLASWSIFQEKEVSFEEVMKNPQLREGYISQIVQKIGKPAYISSVMYVDTQEKLEFLKSYHGGITPDPEQQVMTVYACDPWAYYPNLSEKEPVLAGIAIFTSAFNGKTLQNQDDFISAFTHESRHAEAINLRRFDLINFLNFISPEGRPNESLQEDVAELDAIRKEFQADVSKISKRYRSNQINSYLVHYTNIWNDGKDMPPDFIRKLKIEFFEPWMWEFPDFFREKRNEKEIWYFKHPKSDATYYFSEEEIKPLKEKFGKG